MGQYASRKSRKQFRSPLPQGPPSIPIVLPHRFSIQPKFPVNLLVGHWQRGHAWRFLEHAPQPNCPDRRLWEDSTGYLHFRDASTLDLERLRTVEADLLRLRDNASTDLSRLRAVEADMLRFRDAGTLDLERLRSVEADVRRLRDAASADLERLRFVEADVIRARGDESSAGGHTQTPASGSYPSRPDQCK